MKFIISTAFALVIALSPAVANTAEAQFFGPLIPEECHCEDQPNPYDGTSITTAPDFGCVMQTVQNGFNLAISLIGVIFVIAVVIAGAQLVVSAGNPQKIQWAKDRIFSLIVGMVVFMSAWILVDFVMKTLYNPDAATTGGEVKFGPWNSILSSQNGANRCIVATEPKAIVEGTIGIVTGGTIGGGSGGGSGSIGDVIAGSSKLNISRATQYAAQNARSSSTGYCARYVRLALAAGGLSKFSSGQGDAWQYGPALTSAGFSTAHTGTYSGSGSIAGAKAGDVVVFQRATGTGKTEYGHIAIYDGSQWISDYRQGQTMGPSKYRGVSFTIYRP